MNQKFSITLFAAGLPIFLSTATEMLANHNSWSYFYATPLGFLHAIILGAAFVSLIIGAVGIQLPRGDDTTHADRKTDQVVGADSPDGRVVVITTSKETLPAPPPDPLKEKKP